MIVDIQDLATQLTAVSAATKIIIDVLKLNSKIKAHSVIKRVLSIALPVGMTALWGVSLIDSPDKTLFYTGAVGAGLIAGLGSQFFHEIMKVLQTVKNLKK